MGARRRRRAPQRPMQRHGDVRRLPRPPTCWPAPSTTGSPGASPWTPRWPGYQTERDQLTANGFELTLATARLAALPARHQALYQVAAEQPDLASRIFGVLGGSIPMADVYSDYAYPGGTNATPNARLAHVTPAIRDGLPENLIAVQNPHAVVMAG